MIPTLFVLSAVGGFCSGVLGVGGAVVLIPMLLAVPPLFGVGRLTMNQVAGITMIQVLAASMTGCISHRRHGLVHTKTILAIGLPMAVFALIGATLSKAMAGRTMLVIFGCLVAIALLMLLKRTHGEHPDAPTDFRFRPLLSCAIGAGVGTVSGIVGAGGGFILIPLMTRILKIPMRVAVGSSLGIVFLGALMGSIGKIVTMQVQWGYLAPVLAGSIPFAFIGARVSKKIPATRIRYALVAVVFLTLIKTWADIFHAFAAASP